MIQLPNLLITTIDKPKDKNVSLSIPKMHSVMDLKCSYKSLKTNPSNINLKLHVVLCGQGLARRLYSFLLVEVSVPGQFPGGHPASLLHLWLLGFASAFLANWAASIAVAHWPLAHHVQLIVSLWLRQKLQVAVGTATPAMMAFINLEAIYAGRHALTIFIGSLEYSPITAIGVNSQNLHLPSKSCVFQSDLLFNLELMG